MDEFLEEEGKLGHGFMSADMLEEIDIGDGDKPRPTFISANLDPEYKQKLKNLLKEYKDCFAWEYLKASRPLSCVLVINDNSYGLTKFLR